MVRFWFWGLVCVLVSALPVQAQSEPEVTRAMRRAADYYVGEVATHGGYVYHYTPDLAVRWGEGRATADQIWVQPPGTPTVGLALLRAWEATGDDFYRQAARQAAEALVYGQLESGAWTNAIDFAPDGAQRARYRNGRGGGRNRNFSTLDDGISQSALLFLMQADRSLHFNHGPIHAAVHVGLESLLTAQFPNGAFPQGWDEAGITPHPLKQANYPDYDWRTENRIKEYWDLYTLNDDLAGDTFRTLQEAWNIYRHPRYREAMIKLGDFLLLAQMPEPQPAWAQQYNYDMQPCWARAFEPPAICGRESEDAIETLLRVAVLTGDDKYLKPIPRALQYLSESRLPDGQYARYYELKTNRPLYMTRSNGVYSLTYDDTNLPDHYGWKTEPQLDRLEAMYHHVTATGTLPISSSSGKSLDARTQQILKSLDDRGRWVSTYAGERLVGQPKFRPGDKYLSSAVFSENVETLAEWLMRRN
ncbi:pectate lyase [Rubinisphaera brasiliensis]|uniref:Pectic acid lyase n=1 Tax=Rubinisphaera brasiliensis (strain ATCC 49424 / DSM 5305 / JCM 21570 / IAM 15109 / NBRC 103401 / IFAM 1448) TaxID=756272 RepID=F0SPI9_RUBBR|nr:pectate lyase [Rubinisphaera brasiliensis]ADY57893.1 Pectic acid lyase [Rubinisphaera brasiliensis DSM 5305]